MLSHSIFKNNSHPFDSTYGWMCAKQVNQRKWQFSIMKVDVLEKGQQYLKVVGWNYVGSRMKWSEETRYYITILFLFSNSESHNRKKSVC